MRESERLIETMEREEADLNGFYVRQSGEVGKKL